MKLFLKTIKNTQRQIDTEMMNKRNENIVFQLINFCLYIVNGLIDIRQIELIDLLIDNNDSGINIFIIVKNKINLIYIQYFLRYFYL